MWTVCPAFAPPWYRTTQSARSAITSTSFPFPSSPHWAPTTTTVLVFESNIERGGSGTQEAGSRGGCAPAAHRVPATGRDGQKKSAPVRCGCVGGALRKPRGDGLPRKGDSLQKAGGERQNADADLHCPTL